MTITKTQEEIWEAEDAADLATFEATLAAKAEYDRATAAIEMVDRNAYVAYAGLDNAEETLLEDETLERDSARYWEIALGSLFTIVLEPEYAAERASLEAAGFQF